MTQAFLKLQRLLRSNSGALTSSQLRSALGRATAFLFISSFLLTAALYIGFSISESAALASALFNITLALWVACTIASHVWKLRSHPFFLIPIFYLFFFSLGIAPGLKFDVSPLLFPFMAWLGARYGKLAFYTYIISTFPLAIFTYGFGAATLGLGFDWYAISLLVLWIYAETSTPLRLPQVAAAAVHLLYRKPVLTSIVLGTSIYLHIGGLGIRLSLVHIEVLTFFALGAVYAHILYTYHLVRFINALLSATVIGAILHSASMFEPFSDLAHEVSVINVAISLPGVQEMMSSLFGLFSGVLFRQEFEGRQKDERHAQVALVACVFILCYISGFKIYIVWKAIDVSFLFHVSYFSVLLFLFVVGVRWGMLGVITTTVLALALFIVVMSFKFLLFLFCYIAQMDQPAVQALLLAHSCRLYEPDSGYNLVDYMRLLRLTADFGVVFGSEMTIYLGSVFRDVMVPAVYAYWGHATIAAYRRRHGRGRLAIPALRGVDRGKRQPRPATDPP